MREIADSKHVEVLIHGLADAVAAVRLEAPADQLWALVGIRNRGDEIARRMARRLDAHGDNPPVPVGSLDITLYRDDLSEIGSQAVVGTTDIPFEIDAVHVVLVDDVLMTGRSIRAAMASLIDLGRPRRIWLAVLTDRGGRELPICPDFVGLDLTSETIEAGEHVYVHLKPVDDKDQIAVGPIG